jgi:hypothetical protein
MLMTPAPPRGTDEAITIIRDEDGRLHLEGDAEPPAYTAFSAELLAMLRRSGSLWASLDGDTVVMRLTGLTLRYQLTGEVDLGDAHVGQRVTEDGEPWP